LKLIVGISGASGVELGLKFIKYLPKNIEVFVVATNAANLVLEKENNIKEVFDNSKIEASISSGSFGVDATAIIPCSMNTKRAKKASFGSKRATI